MGSPTKTFLTPPRVGATAMLTGLMPVVGTKKAGSNTGLLRLSLIPSFPQFPLFTQFCMGYYPGI